MKKVSKGLVLILAIITLVGCTSSNKDKENATSYSSNKTITEEMKNKEMDSQGWQIGYGDNNTVILKSSSNILSYHNRNNSWKLENIVDLQEGDTSFNYSPNGSYAIISNSKENSITFVDLNTNRRKVLVKNKSLDNSIMNWSNNSKYFAAILENILYIYNVQEDKFFTKDGLLVGKGEMFLDDYGDVLLSSDNINYSYKNDGGEYNKNILNFRGKVLYYDSNRTLVLNDNKVNQIVGDTTSMISQIPEGYEYKEEEGTINRDKACLFFNDESNKTLVFDISNYGYKEIDGIVSLESFNKDISCYIKDSSTIIDVEKNTPNEALKEYEISKALWISGEKLLFVKNNSNKYLDFSVMEYNKDTGEVTTIIKIE